MGTIGKQQGERKEANPAPNAKPISMRLMERNTSCMGI